MNREAHESGAPTAPRNPTRAKTRRRWAAGAVAILALGALGGLVVPAWRRHELATRIRAELPAVPDPSTMPAMLAERLAQAQREATSSGDAVAGLIELGRLYDASGYGPQAEACWQLLRFAQPHEARWCYYLADLRRTAGDYAGAIARFTQAARLAPDYAPVWLSLADLELKSSHLDAAARDYRRRLDLLPGDPYARLGLARIALLQGRRDEARTLLEQLVKDAPAFPTGHNLYAEILAAAGDAAGANRQRLLGQQSGRFREASDPWLDTLIAWCFNYDRLCIRGTVDYQTKYGDRGEWCFKRAIQLRPDVLTAYELLGSLYGERHEPAKARDLFEEGLRRAKTPKPTAMFYVNLSRAYREMKEPAEAVRVAREGLARVGDAFELYDALGTALGDLGRHEEAVKALQAAVARDPNDANANYNLAVALIAVRRLDGAIAALHQSLTLKPTFPATLALLAQIEMDSGRWQAATQYLQPLFASHPEMHEARQLMANWHLRAGMDAQTKGDLPAAEKHFRDGLAIEPNHAELQASLGALYLIEGRFADAVAPLEAYHRLQPNDPQSALFLGQAYAATGRPEQARKILTEGLRLALHAGNTTTARHCREMLDQL
jgi:tetratricopeptide (TPR) repeat protein